MTRIPALRIVQRGLGGEGAEIPIYLTAMTLGQLRHHAKVDTWNPNNAEGYQRPLEDRRLRAVARYVMEQQGILPTSILLGTRPDDKPQIKPEGFDKDGKEGVPQGWLVIPDDALLWMIDGQHRYFGVNSAFERDGRSELEHYQFPVAIMWHVDRYQEMTHFNIINTAQKKMSTDIVDRHLLQMQKVLGPDMFKMAATKSRGEKDYGRAVATKLSDRLWEEEGPWYHQIKIPGVPGRDQGLVRQHAFVTSIEPFLKDNWVKGLTDDDQVKVLINFWAAAAEVWPEAFEKPEDFRVQATVGIYSLHMVLPVIIELCRDQRDLTKESFAKVLKGTAITSDFWAKEGGDPRTLGTGMSSIRALAQYIQERLPGVAKVAVKL